MPGVICNLETTLGNNRVNITRLLLVHDAQTKKRWFY
jgi:hypothetical protein